MNALAPQVQKRREDIRFVTGRGRYTGDLKPEGQVHLVFVRSPHAHARILGVDTGEARTAEGVIGVYTAADLEAAGIKPIAGGFKFARPDGSPCPKSDRPALAGDRVRYLGEAVAAVVATTPAAATAAAEQVAVDYEDEPAAAGFSALDAGAPVVWEDAPDNVAFRWAAGDAEATEAALKSAAHVTRLSMEITRVAANPMETRNILARVAEDGRLTIHASHQSPYTLRDGLVAAGFDKETLAVEIRDVGGSFGLKMGVAPEDIVVAFAARTLNLPVIWESTRAEAFLADDHGRGVMARGEIGFDADNRIVGLRVHCDANLGAYVGPKSGWTITNMGGIAGVYDIPAIAATVDGFFTHSAHTAAYRGAGRPEATYIVERLLDTAARELNISPFALRRQNLIPPQAMPYQTALIFKYDCGEFAANMTAAERLADLDGFPARRAESGRQGRLRGLGVANCIEVAGGPYGILAADFARAALLADGRLRVRTGTMSVGQGHETTFSQMLADAFGVPAEQVTFVQGDTDALPGGRGNGGSSGLSTGGSAVTEAAGGLVKELTILAAEKLGTTPDAVSVSGGIFRSRDGNRTLNLADLAAQLPQREDGAVAEAQGAFKPPEVTYPNGTHICEVEIDPDTGVVDLVGYYAIEDIGVVIHPMLAEGQIQGGVAQGLGQALGERIAYDADGQLLTGTFMDYHMPRATDLPSYKLGFNPVPTKMNPLGAKGVGEAGTVGSLAAAMNAVNDALARRGVRSFDMPATPSRVWAALRDAR